MPTFKTTGTLELSMVTRVSKGLAFVSFNSFRNSIYTIRGYIILFRFMHEKLPQ